MSLIYRIFSFAERRFARLQGKGMGAHSIGTEVGAVTQFVKPLGLVVDIGGNVGDYTAEVLLRFPKAQIHVFEPSAVNIGKLNHRFGQNNRVIIHQKALSDAAGKMTLYADSPGSGLGSLSKRDLSHHHLDFSHEETVLVERFDAMYIEYLTNKTIDLVKIDVEGHELAVLRGFGDVLSSVRIIQFEFGGCNVDTRTFFKDFWDFFTEKGFSLYRITPMGVQAIFKYNEQEEAFTTTNFLAVNNKLKG